MKKQDASRKKCEFGFIKLFRRRKIFFEWELSVVVDLMLLWIKLFEVFE